MESLNGAKDYFISGSLSFLPLIDYYREPGYDIDISINRNLFKKQKHLFWGKGKVHVLNVTEVAVANTSPLTKIIAPKTGFIHIETEEGLIDISLYEDKDNIIGLIMGAGIRFVMTKEFEKRVNILEWKGRKYRAAPPEMMFLTKSVNYFTSIKDGSIEAYKQTKHYEDIKRMHPIIDWDFASLFLDSLRVQWINIPLPESIQNIINPYTIINLERLRNNIT
jgi:hypothetical protein